MLTARDRPPVDRYAPRRGQSAGGVSVAVPRTLARGLVDELAFLPRTRNDETTVYERMPFYSHSRFIPPPVDGHNWTAAGPWRAELGMRNAVYRPEQGASASRFPFVPDAPTGGLHTMVPSATARTSQRYLVTPQMAPGRQDRLSPSRYAGQTYSQTTAIQGG